MKREVAICCKVSAKRTDSLLHREPYSHEVRTIVGERHCKVSVLQHVGFPWSECQVTKTDGKSLYNR